MAALSTFRPALPSAVLAGLVLLSAGLVGCAAPSPRVELATPAPVNVLPATDASRNAPATGAIFRGDGANLFGNARARAVGDVITVMLDESTQASRQQSNNVKRESSNDVVPQGLTQRVSAMKLPTRILGTNLDGVLGGINLNKAAIESKGGGDAAQNASLQGAITVHVIEVLANGNLVIRGEKQLALTEGIEVIQVSGIVRPEDISPTNVVMSRRLANAQISYRGAGDLASATKPGWGTNLLYKIWPF
mgnify:CR=1 FL=1